jgi:hypothetical protein
MQSRPLWYIPLLTVALASIYLTSVNAANIAPGIDIRSNDTYQGFTSWSNTLYFTSMSMAGTGDIIDFSNVRLGAAGYTWARFGLCSDDSATNITLTHLNHYSLTYTWTGTGGPVRIWCPDAGEPNSVTNGILTSWDATYRVATITPLDETVTVNWGGTTTAANQSYDMFYFAFMLLSLCLGVGLGVIMLRSGTPSFEAVMLYIMVVTIIYAITQLGLQVISRLS